MTFEGDTLATGGQEVTITPNKSVMIEKLNTREILDKGYANTSFLYMRLEDDAGNLLSDNRQFFVHPKDWRLPAATLETSFSLLDGKPMVTLKATSFFKNTYLMAEGIEGRFSDNFFDLNAGQSKEVTFIPSDSEGSQNLEPYLKIITLNKVTQGSLAMIEAEAKDWE